MRWWPGECKPGDMVRVKLGSIYHYGIFVSDGEVIQFGPPPVGTRAPDEKITVCSTDAATFCCGHIIETAVFDKKDRHFSPEETVSRARARLGEGGYSLVHNNCEHFAYECALGVKRSTQEEDARRRWNSRPILDVYLAAVPHDLRAGTVDDPVRAADLEKTSNEALRAQRWLAWKVLEYAVKRSFGLDPADAGFTRDRHGKWSAGSVFISLSHTDTAVAAAVSNAPVGVDMESPGSRSFAPDKLGAMARRVLTADEKRRWPDCPPEVFLELWTKKEAIFKCRGGRRFVPSSTDTLKENTVTVHLTEPAELTLSLCGDRLGAVRLFNYDGRIARLMPFGDGSC